MSKRWIDRRIPAFGAMAPPKSGASGAVLIRLARALLAGIGALGARGQRRRRLLVDRFRILLAAHGRERNRGGGLRRAGAQGAVRAVLLLGSALVLPERVWRQGGTERSGHWPQYVLRSIALMALLRLLRALEQVVRFRRRVDDAVSACAGHGGRR